MKRISIHFFLLLFWLTSCSCPQKYHPSDNPPPLPECPLIVNPVKIALVLGGGGAKGLAHVGALEVLEEHNIQIDLVIGCSAGSIVGALYADYPCTDHLKDLLMTMNTDHLIDINIWSARYGLCQGKSLRRFLKKNLRSQNFDELQIPFFLVTTDLYSCELVTIGGGPIIPAVEASCAIPLVFVPVFLHGRAFVDGGVIDPVPVRVAKHFNAEVIIAVDLRGELSKTFPTNLFGVASRSADISWLWQSEECLHHADVVIRPDLKSFGTFSDNCNEQIYQAGRNAAERAMPQILAAIAKANQCQTE